jgi:arginyl-tRNA synthetase
MNLNDIISERNEIKKIQEKYQENLDKWNKIFIDMKLYSVPMLDLIDVHHFIYKKLNDVNDDNSFHKIVKILQNNQDLVKQSDEVDTICFSWYQFLIEPEEQKKYYCIVL